MEDEEPKPIGSGFPGEPDEAMPEPWPAVADPGLSDFWIGAAIMAISFAALFWWGAHFGMFGKGLEVLARPLALYGALAWVGLAGFGFVYMVGGPVLAFRFVVVAILAVTVGAFRRTILHLRWP